MSPGCAKVHPHLAVVSDGAGQFNVGSTHGMCWVHAERLIHKLVAGENADLMAAQEQVRTQVWALFRGLRAYQGAPSAPQALALSAEFDQVFTQNTCFVALNKQLARLYEHLGTSCRSSCGGPRCRCTRTRARRTSGTT